MKTEEDRGNEHSEGSGSTGHIGPLGKSSTHMKIFKIKCVYVGGGRGGEKMGGLYSMVE